MTADFGYPPFLDLGAKLSDGALWVKAASQGNVRHCERSEAIRCANADETAQFSIAC